MKMRSTECNGWRESIRAWVAEGATSEQANRIQNHLAGCEECRHYAEGLRAAAAGLRWLASQKVEPSPSFRARWMRAVEEAAEPRGRGEIMAALAAWWREWQRRNLRPAVAVASLWVLVVLFRLSAPEVSPVNPKAVAHSPAEIYQALKVPEQMLAEAPEQSRQAPATRQKPNATRPRSEGRSTEPTAHAPHAIHLTSVTLPSQPLLVAALVI